MFGYLNLKFDHEVALNLPTKMYLVGGRRSQVLPDTWPFKRVLTLRGNHGCGETLGFREIDDVVFRGHEIGTPADSALFRPN